MTPEIQAPPPAPLPPPTWKEILDRIHKVGSPAGFLCRCARALRLRIAVIAEIGVYQGQGAHQFRHCFPDAMLYLIDPWRHVPELRALGGRMHREGVTAKNNQRIWDAIYQTVRAGFAADKNAEFLRATSAEAAPKIPDDYLDAAFIDGDHRYEFVCEDIKLWTPKVRRGGFLAGHDYKPVRARRQLYQAYAAVNDTLGRENIVTGPRMTWLWRRP
jgi:hypothetical protein